MNYYKSRKKKELENFKFYLISVAKIKETTADAYCKRITTICKEEEIDFSYLCKNIERFINDYTDGKKKELGARSHNTYSSALKQLSNYLNHNSDLRSEPEGVVEISKIDDKTGQITVTFKDEFLGKMPIFVNNYSKDTRSYYVTEKIIQMCLPTIFKNNPEKIYDFLEYAGFELKFKEE